MQLEQIIPYCDIIIGNEAEAAAWAQASGQPDTEDLTVVARTLALLPKANPAGPRTVVITQGPHSTIVVTSTDAKNPKIYPVNPLKDEDIVDTNGAGDAFAGGFLGALVAGHSLDKAVEVGHKLGAMCVQLVSRLQWPLFSLFVQSLTSHLQGRTTI